MKLVADAGNDTFYCTITKEEISIILGLSLYQVNKEECYIGRDIDVKKISSSAYFLRRLSVERLTTFKKCFLDAIECIEEAKEVHDGLVLFDTIKNSENT